MAKLSSALIAVVSVFVIVPVAAQQQPAQLPEGEGKALVQGMCTACHETNQITRSSGYSREGWREVIQTMVNVSGTPAGETITKYLATHFPATTQLKPNLLRGETSITMREWTVPTLGQRARDPVQAPDGSIWWAGMWANLIGRINPNTGEVTEYTLPENAKPHTVTPDPQGNIWYTGNSNGTIGKLDPRTGMITEYKMPDPAAKDPHTAIFDKTGQFVVHLAGEQHGGPLGSGDGRDQAGENADGEFAPLRHRVERRRQPLGLLQRQQLFGQNRSGDDGDPGIQIAGPEDHRAASRFRERRDDLVCQFLARPAGPDGSEDRTG